MITALSTNVSHGASSDVRYDFGNNEQSPNEEAYANTSQNVPEPHGISNTHPAGISVYHPGTLAFTSPILQDALPEPGVNSDVAAVGTISGHGLGIDDMQPFPMAKQEFA